MRKTALALTSLSLAALASVAIAQTPAPSTPGPSAPGSTAAQPSPERPQRPMMTRADLDSLTDARVAAIQAGLKLTPEQQALWPEVEKAIRATAAERAARFEQRRERMAQRDQQVRDREERDFLARLERRSELASRNAEALRSFATAMKPFYAALDERQKRLLPVLLRPVGGARMAYAGGRRERMMERRGHGPGHHQGGRGGPDMMRP